MIIKAEVQKFISNTSKEFIKDSIYDLADLYIQKKVLKTLEKGSEEYEALEKLINNNELFLNGNIIEQNITEKQSRILKKLRLNVNLKASNELVEEYKKRVDEILKEME